MRCTQAWPKHKKLCKILKAIRDGKEVPDTESYCGLCGNTLENNDPMYTDCCGRVICDDEDDYVSCMTLQR